MDLTEFWPVILLVSYFALYGLLWLSASMCQVPQLSAGKLAMSALVLLIALGALNLWVGSMASGLSSLSSGAELIVIPIWLGAHFLLTLFVVPWTLRPSPDYGFGKAWGAAAVSGVLLCILICFAWYVAARINTRLYTARATAQKQTVLSSYGLPSPPDAKFDSVNVSMPAESIAHARSDPNYKRWSQAWTERWPCNKIVMFDTSEAPAATADFLEQNLSTAGFSVRRQGTSHVTGSKSGLFVAYSFGNIGRNRWAVRIWQDFASEMEQVCAAEMRSP